MVDYLPTTARNLSANSDVTSSHGNLLLGHCHALLLYCIWDAIVQLAYNHVHTGSIFSPLPPEFVTSPGKSGVTSSINTVSRLANNRHRAFARLLKGTVRFFARINGSQSGRGMNVSPRQYNG